MSEKFDAAYAKSNDLREISSRARHSIATTAKAYNFDKAAAKRLTNFFYTKGNGWLDGNPLAKDDKFVGKSDVISALFNKLVDVIQDFKTTGLLSELNQYLDVLYLETGIRLDIPPVTPNRYAAKIKEELSAIANNEYDAWYDASKDLKDNHIAALVNDGELLGRHFSKLCTAQRKADDGKCNAGVIDALHDEADITMNETKLVPLLDENEDEDDDDKED